MAKTTKKATAKKGATKKKATGKKTAAAKKTAAGKKAAPKQPVAKQAAASLQVVIPAAPPRALGASASVLDRLWTVIETRRSADPEVSHSARLLSRGTAKVAQKFGEEAVECLIEATRGNPEGVVAESADVLYHLLVLWVDAGIRPEHVWAELQRREGVSGIAEKAARARSLPARMGMETRKIP
jgi:phosphoribosyl-ATP pyrophosphohydrolase